MKWQGVLSRVTMNVPYGTPLTALPAIQDLVHFAKEVRRAATSALTFMTFS